MTSERIEYDEYDALLQAGSEFKCELSGLPEAPGQWATGVYWLTDGRTLTVMGDGTATLFDPAKAEEERQAQRAAAIEALEGREVTLVTQEFVTWTVRDGVVTACSADLRGPDLDFLSDLYVEGLSWHVDDASECYVDENHDDGEPPADQREVLDLAENLVKRLGLQVADPMPLSRP